ncbi:gamma tubulin complex Spc97/GCP2 subunit Alp4, partial [Spiromyces aspiralis]
MPYPRQLHEGPQFAGGFAVRASRTYQHHTRIPSHSEAEDDHLGYDYDDTDQHMFQSSFRLDDWWARAPLEPRPLNKLAYSEVRPQGGVDIAPLGSFSLAHQEMLIMDDLLYVMIGIQGKYIEIRLPTTSCHQSSTEAQSAIDQIDYIVDETMDPSLKAMVFKILPIASYYIEIERFSIAYTRAAAGLVNQALCAAIRSLLREHTVLVAQLEHRLRSCTAKSPFTLQQFWFHIHPTLRVLQRVAMLVEAIKKEVLLQQQELDRKEQEKGLTTIIGDIDEDDEDDVDDGDDEKAGSGEGGGKADRLDGKGSGSEGEGERTRHSFYERNIYVRGGRTLNIIAEQLKIHGGDATTRELYSFLLYQASAPFFQMLRKWLKYGQIDDSSARGPENGEFMIRHVQGKIAALASTDEEVIVIQERDDIQKSKENVILKFYLQPDLTPNFLRPFGKRVILTGKYLNVVKACGVDLDGIASESMKTDGVEGDNEKDGKEILDTLNTLALKESESAMENSDVMKALDGR